MASPKDRELLIRIDERTATMAEALVALSAKFEEHIKEDVKQFESLKKWRAYITGAVSVTGFLVGSGAVWALMK
jgi:hypothetical protein